MDKNKTMIRMDENKTIISILSDIILQQDVDSLIALIFEKLSSIFKLNVISLFARASQASDNSGCLLIYDGKECERVANLAYGPFAPNTSGANAASAILDLSTVNARLPEVAPHLERRGVRSCYVASLQIDDRQVGILLFCSDRQQAFNEANLTVIQSIVGHLGACMDRIAAREEADRRRLLFDDNQKRLLMARRVAEAIVSELDLRKLLYKIFTSIKSITGIEYSDVLLYDKVNNALTRQAVALGGIGLVKEGYRESVQDSPPGAAFTGRRTVVCDKSVLLKYAKKSEGVGQLIAEGFKEGCCIPLITQRGVVGVLSLLSSREGRFTSDFVSLMVVIAKSVAVAVDNALAYGEISEMKSKLARENEYLANEIRATCRFEDIIGESAAMNMVLSQLELVADSDANVLITGETGTGKELVARALHRLSDRKDSTFVKLNCAAIPSELLESELFGHEKGAFTGAVAARMGLMELAHKGTLFLDEIGDMPLALQPKLLRVLQERLISRVGSNQTIAVDFRLVAATNRDLRQMVADHEFRSDLYYRLNVFPIHVPSLQERPEDIPLLVRHFVQKYAQARKRPINSIPSDVMEVLVRWEWPGNIRELENLIERSVILSKGSVLNVPIADLQTASSPFLRRRSETATLSDTDLSPQKIRDREMILLALKESDGTVAGPRGAAARLGMKRTTLLWKMQRLGIKAHREFR